MATLVTADLSFALETPAGKPVQGTLRGRDSRLELEVDDPGAFAGSGDAAAIAMLADTLARQRVTVRVVHRGRHLVTLGDVVAPWWQRRATKSRHVRLGSLRGAWTSARSRARKTEAVLPETGVAPPTTPWPPAPTFARRMRRPVGLTHDPARGGSPRLVLVKQDVWGGERQPVYWLKDGVTTIGSDPSCDVVLPGLAPHHATVEHDADDEFVLHSPDALTRVHGAPAERSILRTGTRVELGDHQLVYSREEWADHGRPYGGRIGGELGHQRPQPPREQVQRPGD
ncbi:FHA domain-containing protein [Nocardioides sp. GCM10027113]|uniref:FHA domain-containing protein n=1 Tax=unclassified Nocardioides TaxID=2615069 RepID=UPI003613184A